MSCHIDGISIYSLFLHVSENEFFYRKHIYRMGEALMFSFGAG